MNIGTTLKNKKNGNMAKITAIAEDGSITILENNKERPITKKTLTNYYRVVAEAEPTIEAPNDEVEHADTSKSDTTTKVSDFDALYHKSILLGFDIQQSEWDIKKSRAYIVDAEHKKPLIRVLYGKRITGTYTVKASKEFAGSVCHENWSPKNRYERKNLTLDEVFAITQELLNK